MKKYLEQGFTLIELLVVIAIIGILSSVVLASLNTARGKGANAAIKSNLANMRAEAAIWYDDHTSTYLGLCADPIIVGQGAAAAVLVGGSALVASNSVAGSATNVVCHTDGAQAWAVSSGLKTAEGSNTMWCVDSTGASKGITSFVSGATVC